METLDKEQEMITRWYKGGMPRNIQGDTKEGWGKLPALDYPSQCQDELESLSENSICYPLSIFIKLYSLFQWVGSLH